MKHLFKHLLNHETIQLIIFDTKHDQSPLNDTLKRLFRKQDKHHCSTFFDCCHNVSECIKN